MKSILIFFVLCPFICASQFTLKTYQHQEGSSTHENVKDSCVSRFFSVHSEKKTELAQKINNELFYRIFHMKYDDMKDFGNLVHVYGEGGFDYCFDYEIIENSDRFLTFNYTYRSSAYKDKVWQEYITYNVATGERVWPSDVFGDKGRDVFYDTAFQVISNELSEYMLNFDATSENQQEEYKLLSYYYEEYSNRRARPSNGQFYFTSDAIHYVYPFCKDSYIKFDHDEWFNVNFSYDVAKFNVKAVYMKYLTTGVWDAALDEE